MLTTTAGIGAAGRVPTVRRITSTGRARLCGETDPAMAAIGVIVLPTTGPRLVRYTGRDTVPENRRAARDRLRRRSLAHRISLVRQQRRPFGPESRARRATENHRRRGSPAGRLSAPASPEVQVYRARVGQHPAGKPLLHLLNRRGRPLNLR